MFLYFIDIFKTKKMIYRRKMNMSQRIQQEIENQYCIRRRRERRQNGQSKRDKKTVISQRQKAREKDERRRQNKTTKSEKNGIKNKSRLTLFNHYQLLPVKKSQKIRHKFKYNKQIIQNHILNRKITYKKFKNNHPSTHHFSVVKNQQNMPISQQSIPNIQINLLQQINQNQKRNNEQVNLTKVTYWQNSTKAASKSQFPTQKQLSEVSLHKGTKKYQSMTHIPKNTKSKRKPTIENIYDDDAILQQRELSKVALQSKPNRSQSSLSLCSKNNSLQSILRSQIFLPIQSIKNNQNILKEGEDLILVGYVIIEDHMQIINHIANYALQTTSIYENSEEWQQLIFVSYKKYYQSRIKFANALKERDINFFQNRSPNMQKKDLEGLQYFFKSENINVLTKQISQQNLKISDSLQTIYNIMIEKVGDIINLEQADGLSHKMYNLLMQQIEQLKINYYRCSNLVKKRLKNIIKLLMTMCIEDNKICMLNQVDKLLKNTININLCDQLIQLIKFSFL